MTKYFVVDTPATCGAGLNINRGMFCMQHGHQVVETFYLTCLRRASLMTGLNNFTIHIPFQVRNIITVKQIVKTLVQIGEDGFITQIQNVLVAAGRLLVVA